MEQDTDLKESVKDLYASTTKGEGVHEADHGDAFDPMEQARSIGYSDQELANVPEGSVMGLGCGNPAALSELKAGDTVLDLGCGGGLDAFLAARRVGAQGIVLGVDMTPEMIEKAKENALKGKYGNVEFKVAEIEHLPLEEDSVDVVLSNCVLNHCPDKVAAFKEVLRVLRTGGRMCIADLVVVGEFPEEAYRDAMWGPWLQTASTKQEYLGAISESGFRDITISAEGPFGMSEADDRLAGKIVSVLVKAHK